MNRRGIILTSAGIVALTGFLAWAAPLIGGPIAEANKAMHETDFGDVTCNGLYCGGPFFQSPAGLIVLLATFFGIWSLGITLFNLIRHPEVPEDEL